jgi:MFS family permease
MRERLYGLGSCIAAIVCAVVSTAGGWLVDKAGWRAPFSFYFLGFAVMAIAALMPKRSFIAPDRGKSAQKGAASIARLWPFYAVLTSLSVGLFVPYVDGPFLLDEATHSAGLLRGEIFSSMLALSAVSAAFFEVFANKLGENRLLIIVALMLGSGEMMIARSHDIAALFCGFLTSGAASSLVMPTMTSIILQRVPLSGRSRAAGLIFSCVYLGQFLTPVISSLLRTFLSRQGAVFCIGAALIVIVGVAIKTSSAFHRDR